MVTTLLKSMSDKVEVPFTFRLNRDFRTDSSVDLGQWIDKGVAQVCYSSEVAT